MSYNYCCQMNPNCYTVAPPDPNFVPGDQNRHKFGFFYINLEAWLAGVRLVWISTSSTGFLELEHLITNNPALILDGWLESNNHQTFIHNWILTEHKQGDQYVLNRLESEQTLFLAEFKLNKKRWSIIVCLFRKGKKNKNKIVSLFCFVQISQCSIHSRTSETEVASIFPMYLHKMAILNLFSFS